MSDKVKDETTEVVDDSDEAKVSPEPKEEPQEDPKLQEAQEKITAFESILEDHNYDSLEDLARDLEGGKQLKDLIGERDADKLIADYEEYQRVKEYWAEQEELKKRADEDPEDTVKRLEKENKELEKKIKEREKLEKQKADEKKKAEQEEKALQAFEKTVISEIKDTPDIPKEYVPFLKEFIGVDNPFNEVDISSKLEIKKMTKGQVKKFRELEQLIIKRYKDGKTEMPDITSTDASDAPVKEKPKIENLQQARKIGVERLIAAFKGK